MPKPPKKQINDSNTFVIQNVITSKFLNGFNVEYEWTHDPRACWPFTLMTSAIDRQDLVAKHGHKTEILTRKEALQRCGRREVHA